jgi:hypothetical protein
MVPSYEPDTRSFKSYEKAKDPTPLAWPLRVCRSCYVTVSQSRMVSLYEPDARSFESYEKAKDQTPPAWPSRVCRSCHVAVSSLVTVLRQGCKAATYPIGIGFARSVGFDAMVVMPLSSSNEVFLDDSLDDLNSTLFSAALFCR